jgi:hypothetical protein
VYTCPGPGYHPTRSGLPSAAVAAESSLDIATVRGCLDQAVSDEILAFWTERNALTGDEARRRLSEVVCVLRDQGRVAGIASAYPAEVALVGGRRFFIYRSLLDGEAASAWHELIRCTYNALAPEYDGSPGIPIGLCVLLSTPEERQRRPALEWSDPRTIYAGYLRDGRQARIAYFENADITPDTTYA